MFSERERETLRLVSLKRKLSYSHTIRTLIAEEWKRLWPTGPSASEVVSLGKTATRSTRPAVYDARKRQAGVLLEKEALLREERLLLEEEMRRLKREKRAVKRGTAPKTSVAPSDNPEPMPALPPLSPNKAVAEWYEKRAAAERRVKDMLASKLASKPT